jgi:hypothetical protein
MVMLMAEHKPLPGVLLHMQAPEPQVWAALFVLFGPDVCGNSQQPTLVYLKFLEKT